MNARKISLGSANFGLRYGVKGRCQLSAAEVRLILDLCRQKGIDSIDSAIDYGTSQIMLGRLGAKDFQITTKLPGLPNESVDLEHWVQEQIERALRELDTHSLYSVLLHRPKDLLSPRGQALASALLSAKRSFNIQKIGISVYAPEELTVCREVLEYDQVQVPCNVFDQRFCQPAVTQFFETNSIEVHARSVFLQGLLVMNPESRPAYFDPWREVFAKWEGLVSEAGATPAKACLAFAEEQSFVSRWVIGIDEPRQLAEILEPSDACLRVEKAAWSPFANLPLELISPARWAIQ